MSIIRAHEWPQTVIETDVAIVGAGPAGLTLAAELQGDCVVIESGTRRLNVKEHHLFKSINTGEATNVDSLRVRGIGGASLRWTGRCIPLDRYDFEDRDWISDNPWPVSFDELEPWFESAARLLGLTLPNDRLKHLLDELAQMTKRNGFFRPCHWLFADKEPEGILRFGDHFGKAFAGQRKSLLYDAHCIGMVADGSGVQALRVINRAGRLLTVKAKRFVIASGCVESIRLLLDCARDNPSLLGSVEGWLGRGFMQHLRLDAGAILASTEQFAKLQQLINVARFKQGGSYESGLALEPDFARSRRLGNASIFLNYMPYDNLSPLDLLPRIQARFAHRTPNLRRGTAIVTIDTEQAVCQSSYIALADEKDIHGRPRAKVNWTIADVDKATGFETMRAFSGFLRANGLGELIEAEGVSAASILPGNRRDSNHQLGGTRMSLTAQTGVVDPQLKVHNTDNLWVVGGSVFATGGHANPTQVIVALAQRLAAHLQQKSAQA